MKSNNGSALTGFGILTGLISVIAIMAITSTGDEATEIYNSSSETIGVSILGKCASDFHKEGEACVSNSRTVPVSSGIRVQSWDGFAWQDEDLICDTSFHEEAGACVSDVRSVPVSNGNQEQVWDGSAWKNGDLSCDSGYEASGGACVASSGSWVDVTDNGGYNGSLPWCSSYSPYPFNESPSDEGIYGTSCTSIGTTCQFRFKPMPMMAEYYYGKAQCQPQ